MTRRSAPRPSGALRASKTLARFVERGFSSLTLSKSKWGLSAPFDLAERVGFEPTVRKTVHLISSQARSTTPAPLRLFPDCSAGAKRAIPARMLRHSAAAILRNHAIAGATSPSKDAHCTDFLLLPNGLSQIGLGLPGSVLKPSVRNLSFLVVLKRFCKTQHRVKVLRHCNLENS